MASEREHKTTDPSTNQEAGEDPTPVQSSTSAAEASSKAAEAVDAIDEVLEEFDDLTLEELGFRKEERVDADLVDAAIVAKLKGFVQKGGQ